MALALTGKWQYLEMDYCQEATKWLLCPPSPELYTSFLPGPPQQGCHDQTDPRLAPQAAIVKVF